MIAAPSTADLQKQVDILTQELKEALERQTATAEVLQFINSAPEDLAFVFATILEKAHSLCRVSHGSLQLYDGEKFRAVAAHGIADAFADRLRQGFVPGPNHPSQQLLQGARFAQAPDCAEINDPILRAAFELGGIRTVLFIPLCKEGSLIGQIAAARRDVSPFTENEIRLLENFADQAVIAIENARLFNEVQAKTRDLEESLKQQTATAEVLKIISRSAFDLQAVLHTLVESAARLCGADQGTITRQKDGKFYRAETFGHSREFMDYVRDIPVALDRGSASGRALLASDVVHIADVLADPEYTFNEAQRLSGLRTCLGVPVLREGVPVGVISLTRSEVRPFSDKQIELAKTFADQAAIAIENARLFDEVQAKTRDLEEALRYQTGSSNILNVIACSPTEVRPVLEAIVESACELCEAYDAVLMLKDGDELRLGAHHGPIAMGEERWANNRRSVSGRAVADLRPVHVHDVLSDEGADFAVAREMSRRDGCHTLLSTPLLSEGKAIGAIVLRRAEVHPFSDKQIALLQTFADQAVIAISNVELFKQVQQRTHELSQSLDDLRAAQDRLVQTEKLASLGQLTAGIAHEIKNPLNFVNNFSSLSVELTDELNQVLKQAELTEEIRQEIGELTQMLKSNLEKVVQHGKRADSIVKNMLLHSREGSGERRSADINALVRESLNLAYHGARAEKAGFSVTLKHDLDPEAGAVDLYPQEITRALLNLISNGFYAATRRKVEASNETFEPVLSAATRNLGKAVEIRIRDNGTGIPPEVREKIFNPFFTTKPTGEGTGLGLSMTHDIIVKQHGGRIDVDTEPGVFTEFVITLPRHNRVVENQEPE
jgi:signal transduction histidine kinase